ncbi:MAG: M15 family metallopeptidase [Candidatus Limnocylindria bacterium]
MSFASSPTATQTAMPAPTLTAAPTPRPTARPTARPTPVPAATPAPAPTTWDPNLAPCAYTDVLTPHRAYADWARTLVDTTYMVGSTYAPPDLANTSTAGLTSGEYVRSLAIADLKEMGAAASAAGAPLAIRSAYRSYSAQVTTFNYWVKKSGYQAALLASARPGHSEHQLGTAIDFMSPGGPAPWDVADWATTPAGAWMQANAWTYGWVMSYPAGKQGQSCYQYEPWHYRYFGRTIAAAIHDSGVVPRVYLWGRQ